MSPLIIEGAGVPPLSTGFGSLLRSVPVLSVSRKRIFGLGVSASGLMVRRFADEAAIEAGLFIGVARLPNEAPMAGGAFFGVVPKPRGRIMALDFGEAR